MKSVEKYTYIFFYVAARDSRNTTEYMKKEIDQNGVFNWNN